MIKLSYVFFCNAYEAIHVVSIVSCFGMYGLHCKLVPRNSLDATSRSSHNQGTYHTLSSLACLVLMIKFNYNVPPNTLSTGAGSGHVLASVSSQSPSNNKSSEVLNLFLKHGHFLQERYTQYRVDGTNKLQFVRCETSRYERISYCIVS